ncbi:hypothetical protein HPB47_008008 [Ixodes persulcatus]|uniref:Uncharacterized protein n=1 Tax=Ixodes persulcatus TaxID=34615 RepID=A0AC60P615_IXOPE|nr:hypothetical protein HPB47_008008 [Ixodes persulcatus]
MAAKKCITCLIYRGLSTKNLSVSGDFRVKDLKTALQVHPEFGDIGDDVILQGAGFCSPDACCNDIRSACLVTEFANSLSQAGPGGVFFGRGTSLRYEASGEWECSGVLGGSSVIFGNAISSVAAPTFLDEIEGTGSPVESSGRAKVHVGAKATRSLVVESALGTGVA